MLSKKIQKEILERDVCSNHVIPVKLAGERSKPLDSLRMGCGVLTVLAKCIDAINLKINSHDEKERQLSNTTSRSLVKRDLIGKKIP